MSDVGQTPPINSTLVPPLERERPRHVPIGILFIWESAVLLFTLMRLPAGVLLAFGGFTLFFGAGDHVARGLVLLAMSVAAYALTAFIRRNLLRKQAALTATNT